jgi:hypothetical protein
MGPPSQPTPYRPQPPIPWSDDPQVAQWAAGGARRSRGLSGALGPRRAPSGEGVGVVPVVVIGAMLFIVCFLIGYFIPLVVPLR